MNERKMPPKNVSAVFGSLFLEIMNFYTVANDGKENGGQCQLGGGIGTTLNDLFIDRWLSLGHRCTIESEKFIGSFDDKTGVKGLMSTSKVDVLFWFTQLHESIDKTISSTIPIYEDYITLGCSYRYNETFVDSDLLDAYFAFQPEFYVAIISTFCGFVLTWNLCCYMAKQVEEKLRNEINNSKLPSYWIMTCAILDQDQFPNISRIAFTTMSLCFSLFFYITIDCYMLNSMSTDLVIAVEPKVVRSLQDIVDRDDVKIMFLEGCEEESLFKDAEEGTIEKMIWDEKSHVINNVDQSTVAEVWIPIKEQKLVIFARDYFLKAVSSLGITMTRSSGETDVRALFVYIGKSFTNSFTVNQGAPDTLKEFLRERLLHVTQSGILEWYMRERVARTGDLSEINLDIYTSKNVFLPESPLPLVKLESTAKVFRLFFATLIISIMVLVFEILFYCYQTKKRRFVQITVRRRRSV